MILGGRIAVVTGAGGGIGRSISKTLAKLGAYVVLLGGNKAEKLLETEKEVKALGGKCLVLPGNLTDEKFIDSSVEKILSECGGVDVLINNAGVATNTPFEQTDMALFDKIMNINVRAPFMLTNKLLPTIRKSDRASIINIASVVSHAGYPNQSAYVASKHALLGFTKSLAIELYQDGVRVHAISPGGIYTDMIKVSRPDLTPDGMIMPEEIASIVEFLIVNRGNAVIDEILVHRVNKQPFLV